MFYRIWQFLRAAFSRIRPQDRELVARHLEPAQAALFWRMARCDQRHGIDVLQTLRDAGHQDETLLTAALLHDSGKAGGGLTLWHRVAVVLLERFAPAWLARLASDGHGWKAPFAAHVRHALAGAQWAQQAGAPPDAVDLIHRHHERSASNERLAALQWADRQN